MDETYDPKNLEHVIGDDAARVTRLGSHEAEVLYRDGSFALLRLEPDGWHFPEQPSSPGFYHAAGYHN